MNLQTLVDMSLKFNEISGADRETDLRALRNQIGFVEDESYELVEAFCKCDEGEIVKEALDVLVTVIGVLQKMQHRGYNIESAAEEVGLNNLSKYPKTHEEAMRSLKDLAEKSVNAHAGYNALHDCYVIRDCTTGKVRKPSSYVKIDSSLFKKGNQHE